LKPTRVAVLINAAAGSTSGQDDAIRKELSAAFDKHGITADLQFMSGDKLRAGAEAALRQATAGKLDAVLVNGGDGTIRTVASVMADSGVPFGIVPGGTFNHFAKDLSIPLSVDAAVAVIAAGNLHAIDAGEANGKIFINNSSIGLYPYLVVDRERRRRHGLPKLFAMAWALMRAFRNFPIRRLYIKAEGWTEMVRSPCVFVGNNEYQVTGTTAGTRQRLDDGKLCLLVAKPQNMIGLFLLAVRTILGLLDQGKDLRVASLTSVDIGSRRRRLLVAFDGEVEAIQSPVRYKIRPKALQVFVPSTFDAG
jgi:diacylglycerol kinase family enzyme